MYSAFFIHMEKIKTVLFIDNTYPKPYQVSTLDTQAIGGTELSVIKTALILSKVYRVFVAQKFRVDFCSENDNLQFISKKHINKIAPDFIVVLRKYPLLNGLKKQFPKAKLFLWIHTYKNTEYAFKRIGLNKTNTTVVCNSNTHKVHTGKLLNSSFLGKIYSVFLKPCVVKYCYNPVGKPDSIQHHKDENKLLFFSSPNKGLKQITDCFLQINKAIPELKLYIANPGYKKGADINYNANVTILGSLPHKRMMKHIRQSLCVFYPQDSFSETFGLIYAEANAHNTAVLAHDIGSAKEILCKENKLIDANNYQEIIHTIKAWQLNYPKITYNKLFSDKEILNQWKNCFYNNN